MSVIWSGSLTRESHRCLGQANATYLTPRGWFVFGGIFFLMVAVPMVFELFVVRGGQ